MLEICGLCLKCIGIYKLQLWFPSWRKILTFEVSALLSSAFDFILILIVQEKQAE